MNELPPDKLEAIKAYRVRLFYYSVNAAVVICILTMNENSYRIVKEVRFYEMLLFAVIASWLLFRIRNNPGVVTREQIQSRACVDILTELENDEFNKAKFFPPNRVQELEEDLLEYNNGLEDTYKRGFSLKTLSKHFGENELNASLYPPPQTRPCSDRDEGIELQPVHLTNPSHLGGERKLNHETAEQKSDKQEASNASIVYDPGERVERQSSSETQRGGAITPPHAGTNLHKHQFEQVIYRQPDLHYCTHCHAVQLFRTKHCRLCRACISKWDHHCTWSGCCIGEKNHCIYWTMLLFMTAHHWIGTTYVGSMS